MILSCIPQSFLLETSCHKIIIMVGMCILETVYKGGCTRATGRGVGKMALVSSSAPFFWLVVVLFCQSILLFVSLSFLFLL